jgi:hypothetical protein
MHSRWCVRFMCVQCWQCTSSAGAAVGVHCSSSLQCHAQICLNRWQAFGLAASRLSCFPRDAATTLSLVTRALCSRVSRCTVRVTRLADAIARDWCHSERGLQPASSSPANKRATIIYIVGPSSVIMTERSVVQTTLPVDGQHGVH